MSLIIYKVLSLYLLVSRIMHLIFTDAWRWDYFLDANSLSQYFQ